MRSPLGIGEDIDIRLIAVAYGFGFLIHLNIFVRHILEVDHPVVKQVLFSFRNQEMCLGHEFRIQTNETLCVIHCLPACLIDRVHNNLVKLASVYAGLTFDTTCSCVTACNRTVIEQQNLRVSRKTKSLTVLDRHVCYNRTGGILCQFISFSQCVNLDYVVSVESCLDNGTGLGKTNLAGTDLGNGIIRFCCHIIFSSLKIVL